ncbi:hypothetical protein Vadar_011562 [Vaccinium darrowii]|uniref:Uncharacterized protein n=1 Tax=Vaccinium darrowii TaxID=229202 RepID=A0ACB7XQT0_9ERIC|nr:hypothetical protein Vadar_011562 [Vaccinium darrowii]
MSLGVEIVMAVVGLWAAGLRPLMMQYAGEMMEVMGVLLLLNPDVPGFPSNFSLLPEHCHVVTKTRG